MSDGWPPAQGHGWCAAGPASALVEAAVLTDRATDGLRAAAEVDWAARAADLYRVAVAEALHALDRDRALLDEAMRHAGDVPVPGADAGWSR